MKNHILIVDDMPEAAMMLMAYLSGEGFDVVTAGNGKEALEAIKTKTPDLIISDIMMPKMGGFEFIDKIKTAFPNNNIPLIFMSAKNKNETEQMALDLGAEMYLQKPVSLYALKDIVEGALRKTRARNKTTEYSLADLAAALDNEPAPCISEIEVDEDCSGFENSLPVFDGYTGRVSVAAV